MTTKRLHKTRVLGYCDGPVVTEARDENNRRYLCSVLDPCKDGMRFIVVPVTDTEVGVLNRGESCLRLTMEHVGQKNDEWYLSVPQWDFRQPFVIERQQGPISESSDLPGSGYKMKGVWND